MVRKVYLPTSNGIMITATRKIKGTGNGSVLLQKGGPGAGSSYGSIDNYFNETGIDATKAPKMSSSIGNGINKINSSLEKLLVKSKGERKKEKNINFNL